MLGFEKNMDHYNKRISKIRKSRLRLRHKRAGLLRPKEQIKDLEKEKKELINFLKRVQKDYFVNKKITKIEYEEQSKAYNHRLAEIENEHLTLEIKHHKKRGKKWQK